MSNEADGKSIVVQGGQSVGGVHESQQAAETAAAKLNERRPITEDGKSPQAAPPAVVKTHLQG